MAFTYSGLSGIVLRFPAIQFRSRIRCKRLYAGSFKSHAVEGCFVDMPPITISPARKFKAGFRLKQKGLPANVGPALTNGVMRGAAHR
jgi:hypothetical protein